MGLMVVKMLQSLKSALNELESKEEEKRVIKSDGVKRIEKSAIPRRHVSAQASQ